MEEVVLEELQVFKVRGAQGSGQRLRLRSDAHFVFSLSFSLEKSLKCTSTVSLAKHWNRT